MSYITLGDLTKRFDQKKLLQLLDKDKDGVIDQLEVDNLIDDVDGVIDEALAARYELPLSTIPINLIAIGCDLFIWFAHKDNIPAATQLRYEYAIERLNAIRDGKSSLIGATSLDDIEIKNTGVAYTQPNQNQFFTLDDG